MSDARYDLTTTLWRWSGGGNGGDWFFVTVGGTVSDALSATALMHRLETGRRAGWGSVKVAAYIDGTSWHTSAFPAKGRGWMVPIKASVRKAERLIEGEPFDLTLEF